jgi:hypothetical protein
LSWIFNSYTDFNIGDTNKLPSYSFPVLLLSKHPVVSIVRYRHYYSWNLEINIYSLKCFVYSKGDWYLWCYEICCFPGDWVWWLVPWGLGQRWSSKRWFFHRSAIWPGW